LLCCCPTTRRSTSVHFMEKHLFLPW